MNGKDITKNQEIRSLANEVIPLLEINTTFEKVYP
jgi:hypothetical protein